MSTLTPLTALRHRRMIPPLLACAAAVCLSSCREQDAATPGAVDPPGRTVVFDSKSKSVSPEALETMRWRDVAPTAEACARYELVEEAMKVSKSLNEPQVIYLRGLLMFESNDAQAAASEWSRLDVAALPPDFLFAPWHVMESLRSPLNRYEAPLLRAVNEKAVSPLIRARYLGVQGGWQESLESYALTDPSAWTPLDVRMFALMKPQVSCQQDVRMLVSGALAGGRVSQSLHADLAKLFRNPSPPGF